MRAIGLRLLHLTLVLFLVSFFTLILVELIPGDPVVNIIGPSATDEQVEITTKALGLDKSIPARYVDWIGDALRGDLGKSLRTQRPVWTEIRARIPVTLEIALLTIGVALLLSIPIGVYASQKPERPFDRLSSSLSSVFLASPPFLTAVVLVYILAVKLKILPIAGWEALTDDPWQNVRHVIIPVLSTALLESAQFSRLLRADMVETLEQDHILAARSIGLPSRTVLFRYAMRPSSFSLVTVSALALGRQIGGTVIIEQIFGLPGLGQLLVSSVNSKDYVVVQGAVLFLATVYVVINMGLTLFYAWLDPRIRSEGRRGR